MGKSKRFKKDPMFRNYQYSIAQVRRKIDGVVDSAIASSIWRTEFRAALDERPELDLTVIEYMQGCQGCNRSVTVAREAIIAEMALHAEPIALLRRGPCSGSVTAAFDRQSRS